MRQVFLSDTLMQIFVFLLLWYLWPTAQSLLVVDVVAMNDERNLTASSSFEQGKKSIVMIAKGDAAGKEDEFPAFFSFKKCGKPQRV